MLTKRQESILKLIVEHYIKLAKPISSMVRLGPKIGSTPTSPVCSVMGATCYGCLLIFLMVNGFSLSTNIVVDGIMTSPTPVSRKVCSGITFLMERNIE